MRHLLLVSCKRVLSESCASGWVQPLLTTACSPSSQLLPSALHHLPRRFYSPSSFAASSSPSLSTAHVVPQDITRELGELEGHFRRSSNIDGRKRLELSSSHLPFPLPEHTIEPGLHSIDAHVRTGVGKNISKWLKRADRTPGIIFSLPMETDLLLHFDKKEANKVVRTFGRNGCTAQVIQVRVVDPTDPSKVLGVVRAKPQHISLNARTLELQNISLIFCPMDRIIGVNVPVRLINSDAAPGVRKGGWMSMERRTVKYQCLGSSIPPYIEVDVKDVEIETVVRIRDMPIPEGTRLALNVFDEVVVRCTMDVGKD